MKKIDVNLSLTLTEYHLLFEALQDLSISRKQKAKDYEADIASRQMDSLYSELSVEQQAKYDKLVNDAKVLSEMNDVVYNSYKPGESGK